MERYHIPTGEDIDTIVNSTQYSNQTEPVWWQPLLGSEDQYQWSDLFLEAGEKQKSTSQTSTITNPFTSFYTSCLKYPVISLSY